MATTKQARRRPKPKPANDAEKAPETIIKTQMRRLNNNGRTTILNHMVKDQGEMLVNNFLEAKAELNLFMDQHPGVIKQMP